MINNKENPENKYLFNEVGPQKDEPESEDSGSGESNQQRVEARQGSEPDGVSPAEEFDEGWWRISFDGATSREGAGAGIWIRPMGDPKLHSYKLNFECTNNMDEYEALILGLKALRDVQAQRINVQEDSKLIIKQVQGSY